MCTAATYKTKDLYFGRTLDYDFSYAEEVTITPRNFPLPFKKTDTMKTHYAIIGMAFVQDNYPLYYDAVNEKGLCMAGLNFVGNAHYCKEKKDKINLAQYEFILYILGKCATVAQAVKEIEQINLTADVYAKDLPVAELHWIIADKDKTVTVEFVKAGLKIYDNPAGILANNPTFDGQMFNLNNYMGLSPKDGCNAFSDRIELSRYSRGMGAMGLPGDWSSQSRFVRAAFVKLNSVSGDSEEQSVNQFFHILGSVGQPRGTCIIGENGYEVTIYTSCCNAAKGIYYYTTYENHAISAVDMHAENLDGGKLCRYPVIRNENIVFQNR